jgi:hypothetical protein
VFKTLKSFPFSDLLSYFLIPFPWVSEDLLFLGPRVKNLSRSGDEIENSAPRTPIFSSRDEHHLQSVRYPGVKFFWSASQLYGMIPRGHDAAFLPRLHPTNLCWVYTSSISCFKHPPKPETALIFYRVVSKRKGVSVCGYAWLYSLTAVPKLCARYLIVTNSAVTVLLSLLINVIS